MAPFSLLACFEGDILTNDLIVSYCPSNQAQRNFLTIRTTNPATAEEAAVALALTQKPTPSTVITDSKTAVQNFASGFISPQAKLPTVWLENSPSEPGPARSPTLAPDPLETGW